ncbi:MAG: NUDIX domain-containing protein [SAR202 cluster bacterium]|jgi:8-oxo-dGTP pyrophosphatase MutT (NUDIX family)|nr:DNA mismatch repair protein MutT [Chloroflexota bacterium]MDP6421213.1 NUDIX domain-containing protein [SAR202 cluster bacterium]HAL47452.1 DNA mismatch repair protein MutT [Dehalococcoidia bacterium]MDP6665329.1 NUDIX domain-containing protein [SAR202 cluster bacterium]MDP6799618.1 NUDIX domain-containing protein [SAR202 cluster bacterium]|tara:strand:+ start:941 stop:1345 length:405 start_codon:yes stop_codon:yes gene_type:complete
MQKEFHDKVALVFVRDEKVLVALNRGNDTWYLPGGHREARETDEQTLIREIEEELAVDIHPDTIQHFDTFEAQAHGSPTGSVARVACYSAAFDGEPVASSEIVEIAFISYAQRQQTSEPTKLALDKLKEQGRIA